MTDPNCEPCEPCEPGSVSGPAAVWSSHRVLQGDTLQAAQSLGNGRQIRPLPLAVSCVPHAQQPNHHQLRTEPEYKCAVYQNKTGSERTRRLCVTAASLPPRSAAKHRCELCPENIKVMDIELWLISTNRRGRGEAKRGIVRKLKIHYVRKGKRSTDGGNARGKTKAERSRKIQRE